MPITAVTEEHTVSASRVGGTRERGVKIVPTTYGLIQNYPNPFNNHTVIGFSLLGDGEVRLWERVGQRHISVPAAHW